MRCTEVPSAHSTQGNMEPTTTTVSVLAATASTISLALLGVDYYSLVWAMFGAMLAVYQSEKLGRVRAVAFVFLSTLIGAACGTAVLEWAASTSRPLLILASLVAGSGAQLLVKALLQASLRQIGKLGGK